jgi:hypothetical protein
MKKLITAVCLGLISNIVSAQNGLEGIIVEKYYVSNAADAAGSVGTLPEGSVTYRIYADLLPGYKFQALYGVPTHQLLIKTTTAFFNNEDRGDITPTYTKAQAGSNTVMLDSWLSVGGACKNQFGVLKSEDNGVSNVVNSNGLLQNADPSAGIPLTSQDGLMAGTPEDVTLVGFDPPIDPTNTDPELFNATSLVGGLFSVYNGSFAALDGATGPTPTNRVLIAQITTDGILTFELNIQVGTPAGGTQNFVAKNPAAGEIQIASLSRNSAALNIKVFIQGFYAGGGLMNAAVDAGTYPTLCDTVNVELHAAAGAHDLVASSRSTLSTSGTGEFKYAPEFVGGNYYIALHHRNGIETWSASPVLISENTNYDFTTLASKAFGDNQVQVFDLAGYAIYNGDINQDGAIDGSDFLELDPSIQNGDGGYAVGDLNGDGAVDGSDFLALDPNIQNGVGAATP